MGQSNIPLNQLGKDQATKSGDYLAKNYSCISHVYCSTLLRARQTLDYILLKLGNRFELNFESALAERSFGEYEGWPDKKVFSKLVDENGIYDIYKVPPQGESDFELFTRVKSFMERLLIEHDQTDDNILILTHGGTLRFIIGFFIYPNNSLYYNFPFNAKNCSLTMVSSNSDLKGRFNIDFLNYYQYLDQ